MYELAVDCDPDLSTCGAPYGRAAGGSSGGGVRSSLVLLAVLVGAGLLATAQVPGLVAFVAGGIALVSGLLLARRLVRLAARTPAFRVRPGRTGRVGVGGRRPVGVAT